MFSPHRRQAASRYLDSSKVSTSITTNMYFLKPTVLQGIAIVPYGLYFEAFSVVFLI
jgi:hypothetical protein